jgi:hypothetical protein
MAEPMGARVTGMQDNRVHKREMQAMRPATVPQRGVPRPKTRSGKRRMRRH